MHVNSSKTASISNAVLSSKISAMHRKYQGTLKSKTHFRVLTTSGSDGPADMLPRNAFPVKEQACTYGIKTPGITEEAIRDEDSAPFACRGA